MTMNGNFKSNRMITLAMGTALASTMLTGCATGNAPRADVSASQAQQALAKGNHTQAISHAEAAVLAEPRNAAYRAMLGTAYLDAGRFSSASTSFDDAMALGDNTARTALSLALALTGEGRLNEAAALLNDWESQIARSDLGLALALSGQPERGIHIMSNAIRGGENTIKMRQNLAYAYALAGRWREARLMAEQDVPAGEVGDRIAHWAALTHPHAFQHRVADLLQTPAGVADSGQPVQLALANHPAIDQMAAQASAFAAAATETANIPQTTALEPAPQAAAELPAVSQPVLALNNYQPQPSARPADFETAFASTAPAGASVAQVAQDAVRFANDPAVRTAPARQGAASAAPRRNQAAAPAAATTAATTAAGAASSGSHLVQLGSFASEQGARRAWGIYVKNHPQLASREMVITQAVVRGKNYWRVSAGGFAAAETRSVCGTLRSSGQGCIAWSEGRPLPGAVDTGVRMARR